MLNLINPPNPKKKETRILVAHCMSLEKQNPPNKKKQNQTKQDWNLKLSHLTYRALAIFPFLVKPRFFASVCEELFQMPCIRIDNCWVWLALAKLSQTPNLAGLVGLQPLNIKKYVQDSFVSYSVVSQIKYFVLILHLFIYYFILCRPFIPKKIEGLNLILKPWPGVSTPWPKVIWVLLIVGTTT